MILHYLVEHNRYAQIVGIVAILGVALLCSRNRKAVNYRLVGNALLLLFGLGFLVLRTTLGQTIVASIARVIAHLYAYADEGSRFLFGSLADASGPWGFVFALKVLPIIIFFGAFMALLFHFGIVQRFVAGINIVIRPILGTSGAETLCAVANSFLGQTEAPLLIRNYLSKMTKSEMLVVMVSGMGTISGSILAVYAAMGVPATHMLGASVMAIPATILIAKILYPETEKPETAKDIQVDMDKPASNVLGAISMGTSDGLNLALNVGAMLIAFLALIALLNGVFGVSCAGLNGALEYCGVAFRIPCFTIQTIFGWFFAPFGWFLGLAGNELFSAGELIGTKVAVNEMVAYSKMVMMNLSERGQMLLTYALCGFSNFSCIGIQIGGIGALVPEKRALLAELGLFAVLGGTLANLLSAMVAGILL